MYLLDTNVVSELVRKTPSANVVRWFEGVAEDLLFLSVLSLGEIRRGVDRVGDPERRSRLAAWLSDELPARFGSRILPIDQSVADRWGRLGASLADRPLPTIDALLAATAIEYDLTIVTRNVRDFARSGVMHFDPWL